MEPGGSGLATRDYRPAALQGQKPKLMKEIEESSGIINYCSFCPSGHTVASATEKGLVRLWSAGNRRELASSPLRGHSKDAANVTVCEFSPDGTLLVTADSKGRVKLWDTRAWKEIDNLKGHNRSITSCAFSPDGQLLLTSSTDSMSILWKLETRGILAMYTNCDIGVATGCFSYDGTYVFTGDTSGNLCAWSTSSYKAVTGINADDHGVNCTRAAPIKLQSGSDWHSVVVTCGNSPEVKAWLLEYIKSKYVFTNLAVMKGHSGAVYVCRFNECFTYLLTGSADKTIILWAVGAWTCVWKMEAHASAVTCCAVSRDLLATTSADKRLKLWDWRAGPNRQLHS